MHFQFPHVCRFICCSSIKDVDPPQPCTEKDFNIIESVNQTEEPVECRPAGVQLGLRESTDKKLHTAADKKLNTVIEKKTSTIGEKRKEVFSLCNLNCR